MLASAPISLDTIASVFDQSTDCVKLIDRDGHLLWMNQGGMCAMEIDDFGLLSGGEWCGFWPEETADAIRNSYASTPPKTSRLTAFCPTAKGTHKWWDVTVVPISDHDGAHFGFIATSRDVTEREVAARTREVLLQEMRHRQGNTLTLAATLMQVHAQGKPQHKDFVMEMGDRLAALGRAQAVVGRNESDEDDVEVASLLRALIQPLAGPQCDLLIDAEDWLTIPVDKIDVVGVVLSELAVNASKHGAFSKGGRVALTAGRVDAGVEFIWSEASRQPVEATTRQGGQGLDLMGRIAAINNATFEVRWHAKGQRACLLLRDI